MASAPLANTAYLVLTPLLEGESVDTVRGILKERFVPVRPIRRTRRSYQRVGPKLSHATPPR